MRTSGILTYPEKMNLFFVHRDRNFKSVDPHLHQFWELILFERGECEHMINGTVHLCRPGDIALISPTDIHCLKSKPGTTHDCTKVMIPYSTYLNLINPACRLSRFPVLTSLDEKDYETALRLLDMLNEEFHAPNRPGQDVFSLNLIESLLILLQRNLPEQSTEEPANASKTKKMLLYIQEHFYEPITIVDAAAALNYSPKHFSRLFYKDFGVSFQEYLKTMRLNYAYQLVRFSKVPIIDICYNAGFHSPSYFSTLFKERYGQSPNQLRNQPDR